MCEVDGVPRLTGVISWGWGCAEAGIPGVYTNLRKFKSWIENAIAKEESLMAQELKKKPVNVYYSGLYSTLPPFIMS